MATVCRGRPVESECWPSRVCQPPVACGRLRSDEDTSPDRQRLRALLETIMHLKEYLADPDLLVSIGELESLPLSLCLAGTQLLNAIAPPPDRHLCVLTPRSG